MAAKGGAYVRLRSNYSILQPMERKIADYIIKNSDRAEELSIAEIATRSGASNATVTRFCKRLGFNGFRDFRISAIQDTDMGRNNFDSIRSIEKLDSDDMTIERICNSNAQACADTKLLLDEQTLAQAAHLIAGKKRIFLVGQGAVSAVSLDFYHKLLRLGLASVYSADRRLQKMHMAITGPEDVVVVFDLSGNTIMSVEMIQKARGNGTKAIVVCNSIGSPVAKAADLALYGPGRVGSDITGTLAPRIALLCIVDCLFYALQREMGDACYEYVKKTSQVVVDDWT